MKSLPLLCSARPPQEQMKKSENNVERVCVRVCEWWGRRREEGAKSHSLRRRRPRFCAAQGPGEAVRRSSWRGGERRLCRPVAVLEPCCPLRPCCPCGCTAAVRLSCVGTKKRCKPGAGRHVLSHYTYSQVLKQCIFGLFNKQQLMLTLRGTEHNSTIGEVQGFPPLTGSVSGGNVFILIHQV